MNEPFLRARETESPDPTRDYPPLPEPLVVPVYDNHTHLEIQDGVTPLDYREQLDRASSVGVRGVVQVGTDLETSRWSADIAAREPRVIAAVALHPNEAPALANAGILDEHLAGIAALAARSRVRAIGETGLDFFRTPDEAGQRAQLASFEAHIELAKQQNLALQIHDRDAHELVLQTLRRVGAPERTVFHCFSGDREFARIVADSGWYLSFAGTVTFKNAEPLREALKIAPRDRILVETDAPFLTPVPHRGRNNASYLIPLTVRSMARTRGEDLGELCAAIEENTFAAYDGSWGLSEV